MYLGQFLIAAAIDHQEFRAKIKFQRGISLLESLLSVGIITLILLTTIYFFTEVQNDSEVTSSVVLMQKISGASYEWLQAQKQLDFCGASTSSATSCPGSKKITTQALIAAGLISPYDTCSGTPCLLTPWGTAIVTEPALSNTLSGSGPQYIRISLPDIPNKVMCMQIRENMKHITPTGVQSDCSEDPASKKINYYVEL